MTSPKIPDICDMCGLNIESEKQYSMELFEDKGGAFKEKRVRAQHKLDVCQKCFIDKICKSGYKPNFIAEQRNANWVRGSKKIGERYYEPYGVPEFEIKQEVLK